MTCIHLVTKMDTVLVCASYHIVMIVIPFTASHFTLGYGVASEVKDNVHRYNSLTFCQDSMLEPTALKS